MNTFSTVSEAIFQSFEEADSFRQVTLASVPAKRDIPASDLRVKVKARADGRFRVVVQLRNPA